MGLNREQIFEIINNERVQQSAAFPMDETLPSGITRQQRDSELTSHLIMLKSYIDEAIDNWTWDYKRGTDEVTVCQGIAKIATIAVRALELVPFADQLLVRGLRAKPFIEMVDRSLETQ